jgi:hypothetical protein
MFGKERKEYKLTVKTPYKKVTKYGVKWQAKCLKTGFLSTVFATLLLLLVFSANVGLPQTGEHVRLLDGEIGVSNRWGSGWLDLPQPIDLAAGDRIRLLLCFS